ncbi:unnamed protein product [Lymnaea stagnalis]|uniref:Cadherin domain-containing protein n=1 Tax=Lymnaea stagnalis TaxID=6523 RepID=A0AAV2HDJ8_LYMST
MGSTWITDKSRNVLRLLKYVTVLTFLVLRTSGDIVVTIDEEIPVGTVVVRLGDHSAQVYNSLDPGQVNLAILDQNTPPANYFKVNQTTGMITVARRIDREDICDLVEICMVRFNMAIQSQPNAKVALSNVAKIQVLINDVNDNTPTFPARDVTLDVSEGAKVGTEIKISGAVDRDTKPEFTVQHYNTSPSIQEFSIRATNNLDGSSTINLRLERELDREETDAYMFNIVAYDGGITPRSDYLKVIIRVTDDNDNSPVFDTPRYQWTINKTEPVGAIVGQVTATDKDSGIYGNLTYSFSLASEMTNRGLFSINPMTGKISVTGDLRTLKRASSPINMYVDARDGGEPPRSGQTLVSIVVKSVGNDAPVVKINTVAAAGDTSALTIPETAPLDLFVAYVDVEDMDEGDAGKVDCKLVSGPDFKLSPLASKGYTILLNRQVDREERDWYKISVSCQDRANPPLETRVTLTVNITDVNDNTPEFEKSRYEGTVDENRADQFVLQVTARDVDSGANADVTYSLSGETMGLVKVHPRSGVVSTAAKLDREKNDRLTFRVFAVDNGETPKTGTAEVVVTIGDVNDNSPEFNATKFEFAVSELAINGTVFGRLAAYDLDIGANGQFEFHHGGSSSADHALLPVRVLKNGSLLVSGPLDREFKEMYSFVAVVRDRGENPRSSSVIVEVKVLDENDNDPVIIFPSSTNHTIVISNYPENGITLSQIIAFDIDRGNNSDLRYTIYDGDVDGAFSLGPTSGELVLRDRRRLANPACYNLSIKVEDTSSAPRNATARLKIEIAFENSTDLSSLGQPAPSRGDHYIVIVGVIGGATFVLSIIIITAIIIMLHSEGGKREDGDDGSLFHNKFLTAPTPQTNPTEKLSDNFSTKSSMSCSSSASAGLGERRCDEVQKKVSFSPSVKDDLQSGTFESSPDQSSVMERPKDDVYDHGHRVTNPDDSDTSLESSGRSDSGKGTSDDDNRLETVSMSRGNHRPVRQPPGPYHLRTDLAFQRFIAQSPITIHSVQTFPEHRESFQRILPPSSAHQEINNMSTGRVLSHSISLSSQHQPHHQQLSSSRQDFEKPQCLLPSFSPQLHHDEDGSSTSGSYIINQEENSLEENIARDLIV